MRKLMAALAVFTSALLLLALAQSIAVAQILSTRCSSSGVCGPDVPINAGNNNSHGAWQFANYCNLQPGHRLMFSDARGMWRDGNSVSGPDGSTKFWPDNFLNLDDLGVGPYEATTPTQYWDALVGYIGDTPPPARGSYARGSGANLEEVRSKAGRVFPVFPDYGNSSVLMVRESGCLYLAFNADAYSNYTVDNSGLVTVIVAADTLWRPCPDVGLVCEFVREPFSSVCQVANEFVNGCGSTSGGNGQPIPQEQVPWGQLGGIAR